ncbi:MAG: hypothetical protein ABIA59_01250 [Candidatus Latescibacterota bacterium]
MSWINRVMLKCVQVYLSVVFLTVVTLFAFLRRVSGKSPIRIKRARQQPSYWIKRDPKMNIDTLIVRHPRGKSVIGTSLGGFISEGKYDHAIILALLYPVKMFLRVDKSSEVDPSIYVMY